jgi:hypothetical protein
LILADDAGYCRINIFYRKGFKHEKQEGFYPCGASDRCRYHSCARRRQHSDFLCTAQEIKTCCEPGKWKLNLNVDDIVNMKMEQNESKYPVEKAKGRSDKYDQL